MSELIVIVVGAAAGFLLWRGFKPRFEPDPYVVAGSGFGSGTGAGPLQVDVHQWPALGRFDFEIVDTERHQSTLRAILAEQGVQCVASLHAGERVGTPVEVRVDDMRVGYLSDGDASRYQRRLAYEAQAGRTGLCGARIVSLQGARPACTVLLDLKPFRH